MKYIKNCLFSLIVLVAAIVSLIFIFQYFTVKSFEKKNIIVNESWNNLVKNINHKNSYLISNKDINDSLYIFLKKSNNYQNIIENNLVIQENEYFINKYSYQIDSINNHLNEVVDEYNNKAKSYNFEIRSFPNFLFLKGTKYKITYKYFYIKYGFDNENPLQKQKRIDDFIENGTPL